MKKVILSMLMLASMNAFSQDSTAVKKEHKKENKGDHKHKGSHKGEKKDGDHKKKGENRTGEHRNHLEKK